MSSDVFILHVVESFAAGCLTAVSTLCRNAGGGFHHAVAHGVRPDTPVGFADAFPAGTDFYPCRMRRELNVFQDWSAYRELVALMRRVRPDVVHAHSSKGGLLGRLAAHRLGIPSVYTPHGFAFLRTDISPFRRRAYRTGERIAAGLGDVIVACGDQEYLIARELVGNAARIQYIPNAVDVPELERAVTRGECPARNDAGGVERRNAGAGLPLVGICGRLAVERNPALFGALAARFEKNAAWIWIGGGQSPEFDLPLSVRRTGWLERDCALAWTRRLDIYVQTSRWEGLSYGILEAMALGKPVVATRIPPNEAVVEHGVTGYLASSEQEFGEHIARLLRDPDLRRAMGESARRRVFGKHDARRVYSAYAELYARLGRKTGGGLWHGPQRTA